MRHSVAPPHVFHSLYLMDLLRYNNLVGLVQFDVEDRFRGSKVVTDEFKAKILGLRQREVDDRQGEDEDGRKEVEGAVEGQLFLHQREELEAEDEKDAGEAPGHALAEGPHLGREELAGEQHRQCLKSQLRKSEDNSKADKCFPKTHKKGY